MRLVRLTLETELAGFDCGDEDLNNFLVEDAKDFLDKRIASFCRISTRDAKLLVKLQYKNISIKNSPDQAIW